jgi:carbonic anhydrase
LTSCLSQSEQNYHVPSRQAADRHRLDGAVKDDLTYLRGSKLVPGNITLSGWVYEVETGKVRQVA